jgi:hypothetical protein
MLCALEHCYLHEVRRKQTSTHNQQRKSKPKLWPAGLRGGGGAEGHIQRPY